MDYTDQVARKEDFLREHPEWTVIYVKSQGYFEATRDDPNTVIVRYDLRWLLDAMEKATVTQ